MLRELWRLLRFANDPAHELAARQDAARRAEILAANLRHAPEWRKPLDAAAAIRELADLAREPSPELRWHLARWIARRVPLKRGAKPRALAYRRATGARLDALDATACISALLAVGTTSAPNGLHAGTRAALIDLLTGARVLKRSGPGPSSAIRTAFAALAAGRHRRAGMSQAAAIRRAAAAAGIKPNTLQRFVFPRARKPAR